VSRTRQRPRSLPIRPSSKQADFDLRGMPMSGRGRSSGRARRAENYLGNLVSQGPGGAAG